MDIETNLSLLKKCNSTDEKFELLESTLKVVKLDEKSISKIVDLLNEPDTWIRDYISRFLSELKGEQARLAARCVSKFVLEEDLEIKNLASDILIRIGEPAVEYVLPYLKTDNPDLKKFVCDILSTIGSINIREHIVPLLDEKDFNVVQSAIEALGNYQDTSIIDKLLEIYNENDVHKPFVIDALGKIGDIQAMDCLLQFLDTEEDEFLQSAIIDSLSLNCDNMDIAKKLFDLIEVSAPEIQIIILKTVSAIAFRLEEQIVLPDPLRHLSYRALFDNDADIRAAGLLALGNEYREDDFPSIFNEIFQDNPDTQSLILQNLLYQNTPETVKLFFKSFCKAVSVRSQVSCDIDFISLLSYLWTETPAENKKATIEILIDTLFECRQSDFEPTLDLLLKLDKNLTLEYVKQYSHDSSDDFKQILNNLL